ncbi:MAG: transposase [Candidatus Accumulibacter sp.]|nr:transposase [Accumulibacter sp.]
MFATAQGSVRKCIEKRNCDEWGAISARVVDGGVPIKSYGTVEQCERSLEASRWPEGFRCPIRQGARHSCFERGGRRYWQCSDCRHQTTVMCQHRPGQAQDRDLGDLPCLQLR